MNGAESLIRTAAGAGVDVCFTNPGTTEMQLVAALDSVPGVRAVLGLFEGVCTGAADGYGRMLDRPALTLLHLGPGFANGIANLHNARRASSPIVNLIGDHATWHVANDPPLASDIESLARPVSRWVRSVKSPQQMGPDVALAIAESMRTPGAVTTLIVPADCAWGEAASASKPVAPVVPASASSAAVDAAAAALRAPGDSILLLGARGLREDGLRAAGRIATATGCSLYSETFSARIERGGGLPAVQKLPYFPEQLVELFGGTARLVLAGAVEPVSFFAYPGQPGRPAEKCERVELVSASHDVVGALEALAEAVGARANAALPDAPVPERPDGDGPLGVGTLGTALAALLPEGAIVVDEAATSGGAFFPLSAGSPRFSYLGLTGGAIGQGLPSATGAAVACPDRPVIAFQADGSAMYTLQSLWTQAREGLDVTTVICANREYRILRVELARADIPQPGPQADALTRLGRPDLDWVELGRGLGVPSVRAETTETLCAELERSLAEPGPHLIEAVL